MVGGEGIGIVDSVVGVEVFEFFMGRVDEYVFYEESMVGMSVDDMYMNMVFFILVSVIIDDVDVVVGVEVIDGMFVVDFLDLREILLVMMFINFSEFVLRLRLIYEVYS